MVPIGHQKFTQNFLADVLLFLPGDLYVYTSELIFWGFFEHFDLPIMPFGVQAFFLQSNTLLFCCKNDPILLK